MSKGLVYIMTNPCLDGWIKIGMTQKESITDRLNELNRPTNMPLSFRCYATYEVDNPLEVEKSIHSLIDCIDNSLHAREQLENGKYREREFFKLSAEKAYKIFKNIADLRGDRDNLKLYEPTKEQAVEQEIADNIKSKKGNSSFKRLNIKIGTELRFLYDENIVVKTVDDKNKVEYNNEIYTMTALAIKILREKFNWAENTRANGWRFFTYNDTTLSDLRDEIENSIDDE